MPSATNIIMIGMPGVGKSTLGVILAKRLGLDYLDSDVYLQTRARRKLQEIIDADGVDGFRRIEEDTILSIDLASHVIATGGSVVYSSNAMAHLKKDGIACFLHLGPDQLADRLENLATRGIAMAPGQSIESLYHERQPLYERYADITVDCTSKRPEATIGEIIRHLHGFDSR